MNIKFYLEQKKNRTGKHTIWCFIREKNRTLPLNTGEKIQPEFWDVNQHRANELKTKDKMMKGMLYGLNNYLNMYENRIREIIRDSKIRNFNADFDDIAQEIKTAFSNKTRNFFDDFDDFISAKSTQVSKSTMKKYMQTKKHLKDFENDMGIKISYSKINLLFFDKFYPYLISNKNFIDNTANKTISFLKVFMNWAVERELTKNTDFRNFKIKYNKNDIVYLTEQELMNLYDIKLENERLTRVRDVFCFQCFTGQRYSDIEKISILDIKNGIWRFRAIKTGEILEVPLNHYALSILEKYRGWESPLPIISNQKMNEYIKELCKVAKITTHVKVSKIKANKIVEEILPKYNLIGTHTARRTFISLSLKNGMKPDYIMKVVGHSDYRMMKRYLAIDNSEVRNEMDKAWGSSLRLVKKN
ncbi:MAG: tyrosine-type recombinase/integrase [Ignavibacteriae bacterium]|nr:tyrosine-type recombinase/integrase [Ignavibacteriota bacterium]MBK8947193.1 tyrosine-type recombinase/integrase [Ignavibacteriota bacterium]